MITTVEKTQKDTINTLTQGVYTIYDTVLKQFEPPFVVSISQLSDFMNRLVNDVQSHYYNKEKDFILNKIGDFNQETGEIEQHFIERISVLDSYINTQTRTLQQIIQTLNFLPTGYFKMPLEQKDSIQKEIDSAIQKYVSDYVIPDLDVNKEKFNLVDKQLQDVTADRKLFEDRYRSTVKYLKEVNLWEDYNLNFIDKEDNN